MKRSRVIIAVLLIVMVSAVAFSQTAADVVKKAIAASGDINKMKNVNTMSIKMDAKMAGRDVTMNIISANPDKMHMEMKMMGMNTTFVSNGTDAWMSVMGRTMSVPVDQAQNNRNMNNGFNGSYLLAIAESETTKYVGVKDFNGTSCDVLEAKNPGSEGNAEYYFDKASGLLVGLVMQGEGGKTAISMSNYKDVQGVKIPHTMNISVDGNEMMVCQISEIKLNPAVDASMFEKK